MMKSFFKKLAFVMALAMVVSMAAPAGSALAAGLTVAYQNGGAVSELNVKAGAEQDLKFLGAPKNWKEIGFDWTSSNDAVATVDNAGVVTAVADGTATITITVGDLTGSVVVNVGETKAYDVTLGTADNKAMTVADLAEGATLDLNFYGVKDWNKNNYTVAWSVSGDAVTVDKAGVVTAVKAGKAVVTASIVNNVTGVAHNVTPVEVTVAAEAVAPTFEVKQTHADKIVVTFADTQTYTYEDFVVTEIYETVTVDAPIKEAEFTNGTGKEVTIKFSAALYDGVTYEVAFKDTKVNFVASVGKVTDVEFAYYTSAEFCDDVYGVAYIETDDENNTVNLYPQLFDGNGINVTSVVDLDDFSFDYETLVDSDKYSLGYDELTFEKTGVASVKILANWFDEEGEEYNDEWVGDIVATVRPALKQNYVTGAVFFESNNSANAAYTNNAGTYTEDFTEIAWGYAWSNGKGKTEIVLDDAKVPVFAAMLNDNKRAKVKTGLIYSVDGYEWSDAAQANVLVYAAPGEITYDSSNTNIFEIDPVTGEITAKKVGSAAVLVYFTANDSETPVLVGSTKITVKAPRYVATVSISDTQSKIANAGLSTSDTIKLIVKDQYGDKIDLLNGTADITIEATSSKNTVDLSDNLYRAGKGDYRITFDTVDDFTGAFTGSSISWSYNVNIDKKDNPKIDKSKLSFSVRIYDVTDDMTALANKTDVNYAVAYGGFSTKGEVDVKVNRSNINFSNVATDNVLYDDVKTENVSVYYVNKNNFVLGLATDLVPYNEETTGVVGRVYYTITAPTIKTTNPTNSATASAVGNSIVWKFNTEDGTTFSKYATEGTYKVTLYTTRTESNLTMKKLGDYGVTVTNSQPKVAYTGYTDNYALYNNSEYWAFASIQDAVDEMGKAYPATPEDDETIIAAIYDCLSFEYFPEVNNWAYNQATKAPVDYDNAQAVIVNYVAKQVSPSKIAIKEVTFEITLPGTTLKVYQTVRVNASISDERDN